MSVPHILADESSAYYHAYVLAEMSVHQTRAHFKQKYGRLVDNDQVGYTLKVCSPNSTVVQSIIGVLLPLLSSSWRAPKVTISSLLNVYHNSNGKCYS